eukprot:SAG11_NODE_3039_length_2741_cov_2.441711_3_plen_136_part_01
MIVRTSCRFSSLQLGWNLITTCVAQGTLSSYEVDFRGVSWTSYLARLVRELDDVGFVEVVGVIVGRLYHPFTHLAAYGLDNVCAQPADTPVKFHASMLFEQSSPHFVLVCFQTGGVRAHFVLVCFQTGGVRAHFVL